MRSRCWPPGFMKWPPRSLVAWLIGSSIAIGAASAHAADPTNPTVVELFQSQGCSSCPPANANLNALSERPDVLALSFAVTYWDRLGWKDTFANRSSPSGSGIMPARCANRTCLRRRSW